MTLVVLNVLFLELFRIITVPLDDGCRTSDILLALHANVNQNVVFQVPPRIQAQLPDIGDEYGIRRAVLACDPAEFPCLSKHNLPALLREVDEDILHLIATDKLNSVVRIFDVAADASLPLHVQPSTTIDEALPVHLRGHDLYQLPPGIPSHPVKAMRAAVHALVLTSLVQVNTNSPLELLRPPWGFQPDELYFLAVPPHTSYLGDRDALRHLPLIERRGIFFTKCPAKSPSSEAQPGAFHTAQKNPDTVLYCGRPYEPTVPPTLLDATLCELRHNISHIVPSTKDIQCFWSLRQEARQTYAHEVERQIKLTRILSDGGILPQMALSGNIGGYHTDGDLRVSLFGSDLLYYIQVVKLEVGQGDAEPFIEAIHYHMEQVRTVISEQEGKRIFEKVNFPAVLVLHYGPYLAIGAAAFTDRPIAEHLACIPLHVHHTNTDELKRGQRVLAALRVALHKLKNKYKTLSRWGPPAEYPFRDYYEDADGTWHAFTYEALVEDKRLFRASLVNSGKQLYVKFSTQYSAAAHQAAHDIGFAPKLYALNNIGGWLMAVMEDRSAGYACLWDLKEPWNTPARALEGQAAFAWVQQAVREKLARVHEAGYVHGDMRDANVLVCDVQGGRDVLLVDWDWAGVRKEARYPDSMSREGIRRPDDALPSELITPQHDMWMVDHLLDSAFD
ncbi:hypothetical protein OE88DRAFT_1739133 [Heliocybe sulcata]|uniref:Protein kinase domain-containing protein n=1 Tax=Heliocybe sulcata TaxID=5364 RepID=A0A5C3MQZ1_9AGAM|nr:hypothetical protein OE88DRAFT_1739133 [Heliocybe sulcata]